MIVRRCPHCTAIRDYQPGDADTGFICVCGCNFNNCGDILNNYSYADRQQEKGPSDQYPVAICPRCKETIPYSPSTYEIICIKCNYIIRTIPAIIGNKTVGSANDVAKQPHYTQFKIEPITFIVANQLSYSQGNVVKYVCRYKEKDGLKDLLKAKQYITYLIEELETGEVKP